MLKAFSIFKNSNIDYDICNKIIFEKNENEKKNNK